MRYLLLFFLSFPAYAAIWHFQATGTDGGYPDPAPVISAVDGYFDLNNGVIGFWHVDASIFESRWQFGTDVACRNQDGDPCLLSAKQTSPTHYSLSSNGGSTGSIFFLELRIEDGLIIPGTKPFGNGGSVFRSGGNGNGPQILSGVAHTPEPVVTVFLVIAMCSHWLGTLWVRYQRSRALREYQ